MSALDVVADPKGSYVIQQIPNLTLQATESDKETHREDLSDAALLALLYGRWIVGPTLFVHIVAAYEAYHLSGACVIAFPCFNVRQPIHSFL